MELPPAMYSITKLTCFSSLQINRTHQQQLSSCQDIWKDIRSVRVAYVGTSMTIQHSRWEDTSFAQQFSKKKFQVLPRNMEQFYNIWMMTRPQYFDFLHGDVNLRAIATYAMIRLKRTWTNEQRFPLALL